MNHHQSIITVNNAIEIHIYFRYIPVGLYSNGFRNILVVFLVIVQ